MTNNMNAKCTCSLNDEGRGHWSACPEAPAPSAGFSIDMTDANTRDKVILLTAATALAMELRLGMKMGRGASPLDVARRYGFKRRTKKDALRFLVLLLQELDPQYTPAPRIQSVLDSL